MKYVTLLCVDSLRKYNLFRRCRLSFALKRQLVTLNVLMFFVFFPQDLPYKVTVVFDNI